jgi:hypothetical protein
MTLGYHSQPFQGWCAAERSGFGHPPFTQTMKIGLVELEGFSKKDQSGECGSASPTRLRADPLWSAHHLQLHLTHFTIVKKVPAPLSAMGTRGRYW